jgi:soluble lytic murein transglycosylase-like protein
VARLFDWESGWNAEYRGRENTNGTHDYGLAALNSACLLLFRKYNDGAEVDPFDPETAIRVGVRYLAALHATTGSWRAAVGAYNVGLAAWRAGARPERHMREVFGE